jgi:hypothetical protein
MTPAAPVDFEARRVKLAHALVSIDEAISRLDPRAEISGLERLRADVASALRLADDAHVDPAG